MVIIWIILGVLALILLWLLIAPIRLIINSNRGTYQVEAFGIAKASLIPEPDDIHLQVRVLFWQKDFWPLHEKARARKKKEEEKPKPQKKEKKSRWTFQRVKRKAIRVLRSFQVRAFRVNLDTDDYIQNAYLYPVFYFLSKGRRQLKINYKGETEVVLDINNRLYRILFALLF